MAEPVRLWGRGKNLTRWPRSAIWWMVGYGLFWAVLAPLYVVHRLAEGLEAACIFVGAPIATFIEHCERRSRALRASPTNGADEAQEAENGPVKPIDRHEKWNRRANPPNGADT